MIPSAVFVAAVPLQNKFPLSSKFSRNTGSIPKTYTQHMFCRPRKSIWPGSSWKALEGVVGVRCWWVPLAGSQVTVFLLKRLCPCWRSLSQPFSVGFGLRQWCVLSSLLFIVYIRVSKLRPAGQIQPANCEAISPGPKHILPIVKKYIYEKCVDLAERIISRKNHITQGAWPSNCCAIAYVVLSQKFWRALVYVNWTDSNRRFEKGVTVGNCRMDCLLFADDLVAYSMRGSSQQGLQHAFDRFSAACDQEGTKISSKKIEVLCLSDRKSVV